MLQMLHTVKVIRELEIQGLVEQPRAFQDYLKRMLEEAITAKAS
jgi:hypothetical protein